MADAVISALLKQIAKTSQIGFQICGRIDQAIAHACLGSQIDNMREHP